MAEVSTTMDYTGLYGTSNTASSSTSSTASTQDMFITLLLAQVENQDPLSPMDNMDFTNQLVMFEQLDQQQTTNTNLETLNSYSEKLSETSYYSLLDKQVTAYGSELVVSQDGAAQAIEFNLSNATESTEITFINSSGSVSATLNVDQMNAGDNTYNWDGNDENGVPLPAGNYTISIRGISSSGDTVTASMYSSGIVSSIASSNGETTLTLSNGQSLKATDVLKVSSQSTI